VPKARRILALMKKVGADGGEKLSRVSLVFLMGNTSFPRSSPGRDRKSAFDRRPNDEKEVPV
jgi:hypothetical protein